MRKPILNSQFSIPNSQFSILNSQFSISMARTPCRHRIMQSRHWVRFGAIESICMIHTTLPAPYGRGPSFSRQWLKVPDIYHVNGMDAQLVDLQKDRMLWFEPQGIGLALTMVVHDNTTGGTRVAVCIAVLERITNCLRKRIGKEDIISVCFLPTPKVWQTFALY